MPPKNAKFLAAQAPPGAWPGPPLFTDGPAIDDDGLRLVARLGQLEYLDLSWTDISDVGLAHLENLTELQSLYLYQTRITSAGISRLRGLKRLESFGASGKSIDDEACKHLAELDHLTNLVLDGTTVSEDGLMQLTKCSTLSYVSLVRCPGVGDDGLQFLGGHSKLIEADLRETAVTADGLLNCNSGFPSAEFDFERPISIGLLFPRSNFGARGFDR